MFGRIGVMSEHETVYGFMKGREFVKIMGRLRGVSDLDAAADRAIELVDLVEASHRPMGTYSRGMRQRMRLAATLVHDPDILILDEPLNGADPLQRVQFQDLLRRFAADGRTIVLSSHILEEVEAICSRAVVISGGQLVADGTPDELKKKSSWHGAVTLTIHGQDTSGVKQALEGLVNSGSVETLESSTAGEGCRYRIFPKPNQTVAADISELTRQKNWRVDELHIEQGRLDEVFRDLTKGQKEREVTI